MTSNDANTPVAARSNVTGAIFLGSAQVARLLLTTLSTIVIARILSPDDYGVMAMVAPIIWIVTTFQDLGLSAATIQKKTMSAEESNTLFWVNVFASVALALLLVLLAPVVSWFYGDVRAGYVTAASALAMLVTGVSLQHSALLNRDMRFGILSIIDIANAVVTFLVAATVAFLLKSYWALFFGTLAGAAVQSFLMWLYSPFRPTLRMSLAGSSQLTRFGGHVTGSNLANFVTRNADFILIARFAGAAQVGLYDRSYKLMMMPLQNINAPISKLLLPLLSRVRDEPVQYRRAFTIAIRAVMLASAPPIAVAVATSDRLMPFLLGSRWAETSPIFFWLGLTGLVQPIANMTGVLYISSGRAKAMMNWGIFSAVVTLAGFLIGLRWGATGVAASLFITAMGRLPLLYYFSVAGTAVKQRDLYGAQFEPLLGAGLAGWIAFELATRFPYGPLLCFMIPLAYVLALGSSCITSAGRQAMLELFGVARNFGGPRISRLASRAGFGNRQI